MGSFLEQDYYSSNLKLWISLCIYFYIRVVLLWAWIEKKNHKLYTETTTKFKDTKKELWAKKENKFYI